MGDITIASDFLILDVKSGRKALAKHIAKGGKIRLTIDVELDTQHSGDDGVSIEFSGTVLDMRETQP